MPRLPLLPLGLAASLLAASPVLAQGSKRIADFPDAVVQEMMVTALQGRPGEPPLSLETARLVVDAGTLSAFADHCGVEWEKNNLGMLLGAARLLGKPPAVVDYMAALHGVAMGVTDKGIDKSQPCPDRLRSQVAAIIQSRMPR